MKLKCKNKTLLSILSSIKGVVPSRPTFPVQSMVLISPIKGGSYFYTQGPGAQIRCYSQDISIEKPERKMISVSRIYEISRNFPEENDISVLFNDSSATVSCGGAEYKLNTLPPDEFPLMEEQEKSSSVKLPEQDLKNLLEKTEFCMASQDPRHYLNGLFFSLEDENLSAVSTDSHRLALSSLTVSNSGKAQGILPRDIVTETKKLLSDSKSIVEVGISTQNISVSLEHIQILAKGLNGQFPDYEKVIPKEFSLEITLDREQFLRSLQRAAAILSSFLSDDGLHVSLSFSEKELLIKSKNQDGEEANIKQPIEYDSDPFEIAFNSRYLQDVMKTLDTEKVCLQIRDANSGTRIIGEGSPNEEYVVMPLRL